MAEDGSLAADGSTARYRDGIEFESDGHRVLSGHVQKDDGSWQQLMRVDYYRR